MNGKRLRRIGIIALPVALAAAYVAIEAQVRLEEAYLRSRHGQAYDTYRRRVRRWL